jgi:hypothetical protein
VFTGGWTSEGWSWPNIIPLEMKHNNEKRVIFAVIIYKMIGCRKEWYKCK